MISFYVHGIPKGQPRPKAFSRGGRAGVYDPATAEGWKAQVAMAAKDHRPEAPITGPLGLELHFSFPRPKGHYRSGKKAHELKPNAPWLHISKPDFDNLEKAVADAMTQLGFWMDDSQICQSLTTKTYTVSGKPPGCEVKLTKLSDPIQPSP